MRVLAVIRNEKLIVTC